jgi:hypothetical protein
MTQPNKDKKKPLKKAIAKATKSALKEGLQEALSERVSPKKGGTVDIISGAKKSVKAGATFQKPLYKLSKNKR